MTIYEHTQTGPYAFPAFVMLGLALIASTSIATGDTGLIVFMVAFLLFIGAVIVAFNQLSVTVDEERVTVRFRWGWPHRSYPLSAIHRVDTVRNKWWYGFGVRITPHGWMYNVWGLDAVQLNLDEGRAFRIGTDDAERLAATLSARIPT